MASVEGSGGSRKRKRTASYEGGTYILRSLVKDVPLSAESEASGIGITCVEHWGELCLRSEILGAPDLSMSG